MNKLVLTHDRVFMAIVGPSGVGKTQLLANMLINGSFSPPFAKILFFYCEYQDIYNKLSQRLNNIEFSSSIDFDLLETLNDCLIIFDNSCEEI